MTRAVYIVYVLSKHVSAILCCQRLALAQANPMREGANAYKH